jgi:acetoin utilization deacetylase AcuC-like enzyme
MDDGQLVRVLDGPWRVGALLAGAHAAGSRFIQPDPIGPAQLLTVHDVALLQYLESAWQRWRAAGLAEPVVPDSFGPRGLRSHPADADIRALAAFYCRDTCTPIIEGTWTAAQEAAAVALTAARLATEGTRCAYALCRPPGHHASRAEFSGFCYLNNAALAAAALRAKGRVAIVDLDFHHGNGTQDLFWNDPEVFYCSLHGPPERHFPFFSGFAHERGGDDATGTVRNLPMPDGTDGPRYLDALAYGLAEITSFHPTAVVVSLGLDIAHNDPVGTFRLNDECLYLVGIALGQMRLPTVVVQEGGYDLAGLTGQLSAFLRGLVGA